MGKVRWAGRLGRLGSLAPILGEVSVGDCGETLRPCLNESVIIATGNAFTSPPLSFSLVLSLSISLDVISSSSSAHEHSITSN